MLKTLGDADWCANLTIPRVEGGKILSRGVNATPLPTK